MKDLRTGKVTTTAARLKEIMQKRRLKQIDIVNMAKPFCEKYGIKLGRNDISQYVAGKVEPNQYKLTILAQALNVSEVWLMGYDLPKGIYARDIAANRIIKLNPEIIDKAIQKAFLAVAKETIDENDDETNMIIVAVSGLTTEGKKKVLAYINDLSHKYRKED